MKHATTLCVIGACAVMTGCRPQPIGFGFVNPLAPIPTSIELAPGNAVIRVGAATKFEAKTDPFFSSFPVLWSATPGVLALESSGRVATVTCLRAGPGTVSASFQGLEGGVLGRGDASITCEDAPAPPPQPPPPTGNLVQITPTSIFFQHIVGTTACPQRLTPLEIKNTSNRPLTVTVRAENSAIDARLLNESMAPGAVQTLEPAFNCRTVPPIKTNLVFTVNADDTVQLHTVLVTGSGGQ